MSSSQIDEIKGNIEELKTLLNSATRPRVKDILTIEIRKLETELIKLNELTISNLQKESTVSSSRIISNQRCYDVKLTNYAWDQSDKFVKLFITLKNVQTLDASQIVCNFTQKSVEVRVNGLENKNYVLTINNLLMDIDASKSHWKVKTDMVVVFMNKVNSKHWSHLTQSESKLKGSGKKEFGDELDPSASDPSQGLMNLMKKMYEEGDDEMKRTIAKAWTEGRDKGMTPTME